MDLAIVLPLRDSAGLDAFLAQIFDPHSTNYRKYLTPDQFTAGFGPTQADYDQAVEFARQNHLTVAATHSNRLLLDVNGAVRDIQRTFHVTMSTYRHPTENRDFFAPDSEPTVDAALPVADISGLNNFALPHPNCLRMDSATVSNGVPKSGSGPSGNYLGNDFRAAYVPGVTLTGVGQIVGLLEFDGFYASDRPGCTCQSCHQFPFCKCPTVQKSAPSHRQAAPICPLPNMSRSN